MSELSATRKQLAHERKEAQRLAKRIEELEVAFKPENVDYHEDSLREIIAEKDERIKELELENKSLREAVRLAYYPLLNAIMEDE